MSNVLNLSALNDFFKIFCKESGVSLQQDSGISSAQIDNKGVVYVPTPDHLNADKIISSSFQQAGFMHKDLEFARAVHNKLADPKNPLQAMTVDTIFSHLSERNLNGEYAGRDKILVDHHLGNPEDLSKLPPQLQALKAIDLASRRKWQSSLLQEPTLDGKAEDMLRAMDFDYDKEMEEILVSKDSKRLEQLVNKMVEQITNAQPTQSEGDGEDGDRNGESGTDSGHSEDSGKDGKQGEQPAEGAGESEGEGSGAGEDGQPGEGESKEDQRGVSGTDGEPKQEDRDSGKQIGGRGASVADDSAPELNASHCKIKFKQQAALEYDGSGYRPSNNAPEFKKKDGLSNVDANDKRAIDKYVSSSFISKKIQRYLKVMSTSMYEGGKSRGRINTSALHSMYKKDTVPKLFKTKTLSHLKNDTAVVILQDCSGSMGGNKYLMASACSILIAETLRDLRINHELYGFTDLSRVVIYEYKKAGEKNVSRDSLVNRYAQERQMSNNNDGDAILLVAEKLVSLPEKNKILIVLSDGAPASSSADGDPGKRLKEVNKYIQEQTPIHLIGVGIMDKNVEKYYKHHTVVKEMSQLDERLMEILKEAILK